MPIPDVPRSLFIITLAIMILILASGCTNVNGENTPQPPSSQGEKYGVYSLQLDSHRVELIYGSQNELSTLRLNQAGDRFVFSEKIGGDAIENTEIYTVGIDGQDLQRLTDNAAWDVYPMWSPDGSQIAFLSWRESTLDIYIMDADGSNQRLLYDSGFHDADIHWVADQIVFTSQSQIWIMQADGTNARQLTEHPRAGEWGNANLPFGDYDPRISPDGSKVAFSRMVGDASPHGNYDFYTVNNDGSNMERLTETSYTQGLSSWSHTGNDLLFIISAIDDVGLYDIYTLDENGTHNITESYFPTGFLAQFAIYSPDDAEIYFIGQWWSE